MIKKIVMIIAITLCSLQTVMAQDSGLTPGELKLRNQIEQYLREEGYQPTIDNSDNSLNWKRKGHTYWLTISGTNPSYVRLFRLGYKIGTRNRKVLLAACNEAMLNKRCGKAFLDDTDIYFTVEFYCHSAENFKQTFGDNSSAVDAVYDVVDSYYESHK